MRVRCLTLFAFLGFTLFALSISPTTVSAQSLEEKYDATLAAYNRTLNQLEECDEAFAAFQKFFQSQRPPSGASKEDWDKWGKAYRTWVEVFTGCMAKLRKEADDLKKRLDELEKQLGSLADSERQPPRKEGDDKKKKAQDLLKKGATDLEKWTLRVRYKIREVNDWCREASDRVDEHGSGAVKIEPRFVYKF